MNHNEAIEIGLKTNSPQIDISRKIYLCYPTNVFKGKEELEFEILNAISSNFCVPFNSVQVAGSAKTGYSYHQQREFVAGESDLDVAIIDLCLFTKYCESVYKITNGYSNRSNFPLKDGRSTYEQFLNSLASGMFRPDLMPKSDLKKRWFDFYRRLSSKHYKTFKNINAAIYSTTFFFESKQKQNIVIYGNSIRRV